ncbi:glutathione transferase GST 23-like [Rutidosis leptorrhynchoides]|uniref:glutathione transferase GST 23-like n=1 Tax=Rutidosis leptorrhynchoides TaxID=125765 RepID=UPI003A9A2B50
MENVKLFGTSASPYAIRIVWALTMKGVDYKFIHEDLTNKSPELLKYNPVHKKIPVLVHNDVPICESLVMLEYIDETWKDISPLLPKDPLDRAKARFWAKFGDEQVIASFYDCYMKHGKEQEEANVKVLANLEHLEKLLNEKRFFNGESLGFLDLVFGWIADYCSPLEVLTKSKLLNEDSFPNLCAWKNKFLESTPKSENWPDQESLLVRFQKMKESKNEN